MSGAHRRGPNPWVTVPLLVLAITGIAAGSAFALVPPGAGIGSDIPTGELPAVPEDTAPDLADGDQPTSGPLADIFDASVEHIDPGKAPGDYMEGVEPPASAGGDVGGSEAPDAPTPIIDRVTPTSENIEPPAPPFVPPTCVEPDPLCESPCDHNVGGCFPTPSATPSPPAPEPTPEPSAQPEPSPTSSPASPEPTPTATATPTTLPEIIEELLP